MSEKMLPSYIKSILTEIILSIALDYDLTNEEVIEIVKEILKGGE